MKNSKIMVCVTQQKTCERLILTGYNLAESKGGKLYVIHVVNENQKFLENEDDGESLEYLFGVSKEVGANLTVLRSKDVPKAMIDFAKDNNITHMIMGATPEEVKPDNPNFGLNLQKKLKDVEFIVI